MYRKTRTPFAGHPGFFLCRGIFCFFGAAMAYWQQWQWQQATKWSSPTWTMGAFSRS